MPKKKKGDGHAHRAKAGNKNKVPAIEMTERRLLAQKERIDEKLAAIQARKAGQEPSRMYVPSAEVATLAKRRSAELRAKAREQSMLSPVHY